MREKDNMLADSEAHQTAMAKLVSKVDAPALGNPKIIGVDVAYDQDTAHGCAVMWDMNSHLVTRREYLVRICSYPYIPGHFYLREGPVVLQLLKRFDRAVVLIDGNGILHPRRFGLASYIGVTLNVPAIGVSKKLLLGNVGEREGDIAFIHDRNEIIGGAIWLHGKKKPIYVSVGHQVCLSAAIKLVQDCSLIGYPEALRQAHLCSREMLLSSKRENHPKTRNLNP